jgi:hypothetical protein
MQGMRAEAPDRCSARRSAIDAAAPEDCVVLKELGQDARPATCIEVARRGKQMDDNPLRPRD